MAELVVGIDVGGTFTDCAVFDPRAGALRIGKVASTPEDPSSGFFHGLDALGVEPRAIRSLIHGTTVATNTVLERSGCRCGLITTEGFRDVIELARRVRPHLYGLTGAFEPIIPRDLRLEVAERIDSAGNVVTPLDEQGVEDAVDELLARGAEAVAIHFLHSYANPVHEERCHEIVRARWPNDCVSVGARILPEVREFERGTAVALNAYVQPRIARYVGQLAADLEARGFPNALLLMQGSGGIMDAATASTHAIHTVMSGPAAGAIAAGRIGRAAGLPDLISCDLGGTSFDVCVVRDGLPTVTRESELDYSVPMRLPMVDIHTIGAGGGSIARVAKGRILAVGPQSAGAVPGPIAYGRGGTEPTLTDASIVLGRIDPARVSGAAGAVDMDAVRRSFAERIGGPLGLDATEAAAAVIDVANNAMASAIRFASVEKGLDPRDFAIFAFGGGGPLFASGLARELGVPRVLVPRYPGITSALGCILADVRHDIGETVNRPMGEVTGAAADTILQRQAAAGRALIENERVAVREIVVHHEADLQYRGQTHVIRLPVTSPGFEPSRVLGAMEDAYRERFDVDLSEMRPMLAALRTTVIGVREELAEARVSTGDGARSHGGAPREHRQVWFAGAWRTAAVHERDALVPGDEIAGPGIVEQFDTTTVIEPGDTAVVDAAGNLIITINPEPRPR